MEVNQILQQLGLEPPEVRAYLTLLDLGESTATKIAERAALGRVHSYQILTQLIEKGLASYVIKNNIKYFHAADPETLLKNLQEKEKNLQNILPELKARQKLMKQDTSVEIYRGTEGLNTIFKMILQDKQEYYMIGGGDQACNNAEFDAIIRIFLKRAEQAKIKGLVLERKESNFYIGAHEQYRFLAPEYFSSTTLTIWGNKVVTFIWTRPYYAILIENEEVARSNLATFKYLWKNAQEPSKEDRKKRGMRI